MGTWKEDTVDVVTSIGCFLIYEAEEGGKEVVWAVSAGPHGCLRETKTQKSVQQRLRGQKYSYYHFI